jgi:hypothetical protein
VLGLQKLTWYQSLVSEGDQIRQDIFVATQEILIIASLQVVGKTQKLKKKGELYNRTDFTTAIRFVRSVQRDRCCREGPR